MTTALAGRRIVLDCRWLGFGGPGRVVELLLRRLGDEPPAGNWILWGDPDRIAPLRFGDAVTASWDGDPRTAMGQRDIGRVPRGDVVLYAHQIRPFRPGRSVTVIHDTIPLRYGGSAMIRRAKRAYLATAARLSDHVLTDSEFARSCLERDLGIPHERISVMTFPPDHERAARIAALRDELGQKDRLLYLGRFAPHKNLERLARAFAATRFAAAGGRLLLVGGWGDETERLRAWLAAAGIDGAEARPACGEAELDRLLATSRALVLPSFEEGFGLPAFEAAASGLPVAASRTGAMTTLSPADAVLFDPYDEAAIREALDEAFARPAHAPWPRQEPAFVAVVLAALGAALDRG